MAKATITFKNNKIEIIEDIEDLSMQPPYWMVKYKLEGETIRRFISFEVACDVEVHGEEELIQAAKAHVGNPEKLARDLGLE